MKCTQVARSLAMAATTSLLLTVSIGMTEAALANPVSVPTQSADTVLYSFGNGYGVDNPTALIRGADGNYYGVGMAAAGALFRISPSGDESIIFDFGSSAAYPFGLDPTTIVQAADGNFYGTTTSGANEAEGVVFRVTPDGVGTALHSFDIGSSDGTQPSALIQGSDGNFYGVTGSGGAHDYGTVFKMTPTGEESILYSFGATLNDARVPTSLIQASDGNLYGTLNYGGQTNGYTGAVFKVTSDGVETILHSFKSFDDGMWPDALIQGVDGNLYGLTKAGGANGEGNLFKLDLSGNCTVVYSFGNATGDAAGPMSLLQGTDGNFYGVSGGGINGNGTIFEVKPDGTESVLYSFKGNTDGQFPTSLVYAPEALYGITESGGQYGAGVFFSVLHPPLPPDGVVATASDGSVSLQWVASVSASSYEVFMGTISGGEDSSPTQAGISGTTTTIHGLKDGTTYYFTVVATNDAGSSNSSSETSATPQSSGGSTDGGGGGAMNPVTLIVLAGFLVGSGRHRTRGRTHPNRS